MPWLIPYSDPNTGASFVQSYVRAINTGVNPGENQANVHAARWVSETAYSLGFHPVQSVDLQVTGAIYASIFLGPVNGAIATYNAIVANAADTYIGGLAQMSGAVFTP